MKEVNDHTHAQRKFRFDANKEYDWAASVAIRPNQNIAPNKDSKLVAELDMKLSALVHINQLIFHTFSLNLSLPFFTSLFFCTFFSFLTHFFYIELNTVIRYNTCKLDDRNKAQPETII